MFGEKYGKWDANNPERKKGDEHGYQSVAGTPQNPMYDKHG